MIKLINRLLLCMVLIGCIASAGAGHDQATTQTVIIDFQSSHPLPGDFSPVISHGSGGFEAPLKPHFNSQSLTIMSGLSGTIFSADISGEKSVSAVFIDHPGFLRGFVYDFDSSYVSGTTVTIALPNPGSLRTSVGKILNDKFCVTSSLHKNGLHSFGIKIPVLPAPEWKADFNDLAPGTYQIFATVRECGHHTGPATLAGANLFTIKSNCLTQFNFQMVSRHDLNYKYTTPATMEITPIEK